MEYYPGYKNWIFLKFRGCIQNDFDKGFSENSVYHLNFNMRVVNFKVIIANFNIRKVQLL